MKSLPLVLLIACIPIISLAQSTNQEQPPVFTGDNERTRDDQIDLSNISSTESLIEPQAVNSERLIETFYFQKLYRSMQSNPGLIASALGLSQNDLSGLYTLLMEAEQKDLHLKAEAKSAMCSYWINSSGAQEDAIKALEIHKAHELGNVNANTKRTTMLDDFEAMSGLNSRIKIEEEIEEFGKNSSFKSILWADFVRSVGTEIDQMNLSCGEVK